MVRFLCVLVLWGLLSGAVGCTGHLKVDWQMTIDGDAVKAALADGEVQP